MMPIARQKNSSPKREVKKVFKKTAKKKVIRKKPARRMKVFGRPLKFKTVAELQSAINNYFESLYEPAFDMWGNPLVNKKTGEPRMKKTQVATVTGLAVALDTTRETLLDYENKKHDGKDGTLTEEQLAENKQIDDFSDTIKKAKLRIYADTEQQLYKAKPTGAIFSLKNNYGWVDRIITETSSQEVNDPFKNLTEDELRNLAKGDNG